MHDWQRDHLCRILEKAFRNPGSRVFIHAPPQHGKSCIVSVKLPAWILGMCPMARVGVACFNEEHAESFSGAVVKMLQSNLHEQIFPADGARLDRSAPAKKGWQTRARASFGESQMSFSALGMDSGTSGKGFEVLIIDDPYAHYADAISPAINKQIREWWENNIESRISDDTTIIFMYHRYHDADIMAEILKSSGGDWEIYRFSARALDPDDPTITPLDGIDPTDRAPGEPLSPIRSIEFYEKKEKDNPSMWWSQFQGKPLSDSMRKIKREYIRTIHPNLLPDIRIWADGYDTAVSKEKLANKTAGSLVGYHEGNFYLRRVHHGKWEWPDVEKLIYRSAVDNPEGTWTAVETPSQALGFYQQMLRSEVFLNRTLVAVKPLKNDKLQRAQGWINKMAQGRFFLVEDTWNKDWIDEAIVFNGLGLADDDQIDSVTVAIEALAMQVDINTYEEPIYSEETVGTPEWFARLLGDPEPRTDTIEARRDRLFKGKQV